MSLLRRGGRGHALLPDLKANDSGDGNRRPREKGWPRLSVTAVGEADRQRMKLGHLGAGPVLSGWALTLAGFVWFGEEERVVGVQQWAEIRRLVLVEGRSQREVAVCMGLARDRVAKAVWSETPPRYSRMPAGSKLDLFKGWICEQWREDPSIPSQRLREMAAELGYAGGKTIFDDYLREVRPRFRVRRTF
jgi:hypothetical protein